MTAMELNLRKENLIGCIRTMDEETIGKVESFIKRLPNTPARKEAKPYPWAPQKEELQNMVAESEEDFKYGRSTDQHDIEKELKIKMQSW